MNAKQLNESFPITYFLSLHNYEVAKVSGSNYWYISMLQERLEKTPSFKVDTTINRWYDHSLGKGGKLVDLACLILNTTAIKEVVRVLNSTFSSFQKQPHISKYQKQKRLSTSNKKISVISVERLKDQQLLEYLAKRGVDKEIAQTYCKQVRYKNGSNTFYSIGFENMSGGFELRGQGFKSSSSPKDITFIDNGFDKLAIFEGFIDFLSYQVLNDIHVEKSNWLILNSLSFLTKITSILFKHRQLFLFLDNDPSGILAVSRIARLQLPQVDMSIIYADYKDVNEYLTNLKK